MKKQVLTKVVSAILIIGILFCAYKITIYILNEFNSSGKVTQVKPVTDEAAERKKHLLSLYKKNHDVKAWLHIKGTSINYVVMQTPSDEGFYLRKDFNKKYLISGTLFFSLGSYLDLIDRKIRSSDVMLIHGHNMSKSEMFNNVRKYKERLYLSEHKYGTITTLQRERTFEWFACFTTSVNNKSSAAFPYYTYSMFGDINDVNKSKKEFNEFIKKVYEKSVSKTSYRPVYGKPLLMLSTCDGFDTDIRCVLIGQEVDPEEVPFEDKDKDGYYDNGYYEG